VSESPEPVPSGLLNKQQRKKAARKQRRQSERQAHRDLDDTTSEAVAESLRLAPEIAGGLRKRMGKVIDVELASLSEAQFVRKRVNDALNVGEWLSDVRVWIWRHDEQLDEAQSTNGAQTGFELRLSQAGSDILR